MHLMFTNHKYLKKYVYFFIKPKSNAIQNLHRLNIEVSTMYSICYLISQGWSMNAHDQTQKILFWSN